MRVLSLGASVIILVGCVAGASDFPSPSVDIPASGSKQSATAALAGGCFWGVEGVFDV